MQKIILLSFVLFISCFARAHPGIGIVCDSKGNIFYTDLKNIYKITPDGHKTIAVPDVHSHELSIDSGDNIYGEHLWYNGEQLNTWGHYVWCLKKDGSVIRIKESTEEFPSGYGFLRDGAGNTYWVERFTTSRFQKKTPDGVIATHAEGKFRDIRWSYCTKDGTIFFLDLDKLYKLTQDGKFTLLAEKLNETTPAFSLIGKRHNAYGIWTDELDNIYVALHGGQKVKRISPDGKIRTAVYSTSPWSPTSGVFDKQGNLWVLEYTLTADCRVRKIDKEKLSGAPAKSKAVLMNYVVPVGIAAGIVVLIGLGIKKLIVKKK